MHAQRSDATVDADQFTEIGAERVFSREANLNRLALEVINDDGGFLDDLVEVAPVTGVAQLLRGGIEHIDALRATFDGEAYIIKMAADVGDDARTQAELGDPFEVTGTLRRSSGRGQFNILNPKGVKRFGNGEALGAVEAGRGELLTLTQGRINEGHALKWRHTASILV